MGRSEKIMEKDIGLFGEIETVNATLMKIN